MLVFIAPARAERPWYHTAHAGKAYVNAELTPQRVLDKDAAPAWDGQLVLWQGRIQSLRRDGHKTDVDLDVCGRIVPVHYRWNAVNLEIDRTGFRVAIKGRLQIENHRVTALDGKSLILLSPPQPDAYEVFLHADPSRKLGLESFLSWWISFHNPQYGSELCETIASAIVRNAELNKLDPLFLASLIQIESAFRVDIVSPSGAVGLGQLMPFTARGYGVNPWDPQDNVKAAARMIGGLVRAWEGRDANPRALALASYNAGPALVRHCRAVPKIPQTTNYVYFIGYVHNEMTATAARLGVVSHNTASR